MVDNQLVPFLKSIVSSLIPRKNSFYSDPFFVVNVSPFSLFLSGERLFPLVSVSLHQHALSSLFSSDSIIDSVFQLCCHHGWGQRQSDRICSDPTRLGKRRASGLSRNVQPFILPTLDWN